MYAVLVTFRPQVSESELVATVGPKMKALLDQPGLVMKTFVDKSPTRTGSFYLFQDRAFADQYLDGEFFQWFSTGDLITDVEIERFDVDDEHSQMFGTPTEVLSRRTRV